MYWIIPIALLSVPLYAFVTERMRIWRNRVEQEQASLDMQAKARAIEFEAQRKKFEARWHGLTAQEAVRKENEA